QSPLPSFFVGCLDLELLPASATDSQSLENQSLLPIVRAGRARIFGERGSTQNSEDSGNAFTHVGLLSGAGQRQQHRQGKKRRYTRQVNDAAWRSATQPRKGVLDEETQLSVRRLGWLPHRRHGPRCDGLCG